jgi:hypothetical protein
MKVRDLVAQGCQIDFRRAREAAQRLLDCKHDTQHVRALWSAEIRHLAHVTLPDDLAQRRVVLMGHQDDPAVPVRP